MAPEITYKTDYAFIEIDIKRGCPKPYLFIYLVFAILKTNKKTKETLTADSRRVTFHFYPRPSV